jgi:hypothetical protein
MEETPSGLPLGVVVTSRILSVCDLLDKEVFLIPRMPCSQQAR